MPGRPGMWLRGKLKPLRDKLKTWSKKVFVVVEDRKKGLLDEISLGDKKEIWI